MCNNEKLNKKAYDDAYNIIQKVIKTSKKEVTQQFTIYVSAWKKGFYSINIKGITEDNENEAQQIHDKIIQTNKEIGSLVCTREHSPHEGLLVLDFT